MQDELGCRPRQAACPPGQCSAATPTAHEGVKLWGNRPLYATRLCVFAIFTLHLSRTFGPSRSQPHLVSCSADACARRRRRGTKPSRRRPGGARGGSQGLHGVSAVLTPCENKSPPRPVQTGGGRRVAPSSTQLSLWVACSSSGCQVARRLPGRHSSAASPLRCRACLSCGAQRLGKPPPWCPQGGLLPEGTCWALVS